MGTMTALDDFGFALLLSLHAAPEDSCNRWPMVQYSLKLQ